MRIKLLALTFGIFLAAGTAYAGPVPGGVDSDGDTVENAFDNCSSRANPTQVDTDHDGCGQFCDFDFINNNGLTNLNEVNLAAGQLGACVGCVCDFNQNGICQLSEVSIIAGNLNMGQGPSGITTAQCDPADCGCTPAP